MSVNPYETYRQQSILTMTQGEMLNKLYEELVKQLSYAQIHIEQKNLSKTNDALQRAQKILNHLKSTLNYEYEISNSLASLYDFFLQQTVAANIKKSSQPIGEILPMIQELKDTF
ncbi:MAG: flagellar export chaperone FliS, partial [Oscillospiraceae bacterium]